jgi:hypothetical protein
MEIHAREQGKAEYISSVRICDLALLPPTDVLASLTQATNTNKIKLVFAAVKETILSNSLKESGIL